MSAKFSRAAADAVADLVERLALAVRSASQGHGLPPAQWEALRFLARANRYSRQPSAVADYLGATRGTVSQTLLALAEKGLIVRLGDPSDGRKVRLELKPAGARALSQDPLAALASAADELTDKQRAALTEGLHALLAHLQRRRRHKSFGVCASCHHFRRQDARDEPNGPHRCGLTLEPLSEPEATLLCAEHAPRAA